MNVKAKQCKLCKEISAAYYAGIRNDGKTKIYTNKEGKQWNGRECPLCVVLKSKDNMQKLRLKRKQSQS